MSREEARQAQALENIARVLDKIEGHLSTIAKNTQRVKFTNSPPDPFDPTWPPEPEEPSAFPQPSHPYLKRSDDRTPEPRAGEV